MRDCKVVSHAAEITIAGLAAAATMLALVMPARADAQGIGATGGLTVQARSLRCPKPESPRSRSFECNSVEPDFERTLLADWNGVRRDLATLGIIPTFSYAGAYFGNTSNAPREGSYGGGLHGSVNVDFGKLAGMRGLSAYLGVWWMQASNADAIVNTNVFPANDNFAGNGFWVGQLYLQQTFANGDLTIAAGRLGPGATFATLPVFANYTNGAINANPGSLGINEPPFAPPPPGSQWGVQALYNFTPVWQGAIGVYNNNPNSAAGNDHGLDWKWREGNRGALALAQLNLHHNQGPKDTGMPGQYSVGAFWDGNEFPTVSGTPAVERNNFGIYAMAQQQVTQVGGAGSPQGLTIWGTVAYGTRQNINLLPVFVAAGASYQGLLSARPNDIASVGWYYGKPSNRIQPATINTQALEFYYQYTLNAGVNLVLDAQYIFRVNGYPSPGTAVLGAQLQVTF